MATYPITNPNGAPLKVTDAVKADIITMLEAGAGLIEAANDAGISYETLRVHRASDTAFGNAIAAALVLGAKTLEDLARETREAKMRAKYKVAVKVEGAVDEMSSKDVKDKLTGSDLMKIGEYGTPKPSTTTTNVNVDASVNQYNISPIRVEFVDRGDIMERAAAIEAEYVEIINKGGNINDGNDANDD